MTTCESHRLGYAAISRNAHIARFSRRSLPLVILLFSFCFLIFFFFSETDNKWDDRANFSAKSGKYTLLEMDNSADEEEEARLAERLNAFNSASGAAAPGSPAAGTKFRPSELDPAVQELMALCFDTGMFQQTMKTFEIDTAKMRQCSTCIEWGRGGRFSLSVPPAQHATHTSLCMLVSALLSACFLASFDFFVLVASPGQAEQGADRQGLRHPHGDRIGAQERQPLQAQRIIF